MSPPRTFVAAAGLVASIMLMTAPGAQAQFFGRSGQQEPAGQGDPAALMLRIERLENQIRNLTGQLEEAQFQNRRLEEQVRRFQDAAPQAAPSAQRRGEPMDLASPPPVAGATPPRGRGDAFDPAQSPAAPGAPRVLGQMDRSAAISGPLGADPAVAQEVSAPLDLLNPRRPASSMPTTPPQASPLPPGSNASAPLPATAPIALDPSRQPQPARQAAVPADPTVSTLAPASPREQLDAALLAIRQSDFDGAEARLKEFLQRYPTSRLAPEAVHNLGDVYARRNRHREAAEQFLKVTTEHAKSAQAPSSLHRLGQSLERLGAKEQACAAWAEVPRKYPNAAPSTRAAAERELKRAQC